MRDRSIGENPKEQRTRSLSAAARHFDEKGTPGTYAFSTDGPIHLLYQKYEEWNAEKITDPVPPRRHNLETSRYCQAQLNARPVED